MAAIASTQVSLYPTDVAGEFFPLGKDNRDIISRRLKITGVTAADTATASVCGLTTLLEATSGYDSGTPAAVAVGVDPVNNTLVIGSGPTDDTVYVTVTGTVK